MYSVRRTPLGKADSPMKILALVLAMMCIAQDAPAPSAIIYVYRANQFTAKLKSPVVWCDDVAVAKMQNGRYFSIKLPAGKHGFHSEDKGVGIQVITESGKKYFVRIEMAMGQWKGTQQVTEVSELQAQREMAGMKPIDRDKVLDSRVIRGD